MTDRRTTNWLLRGRNLNRRWPTYRKQWEPLRERLANARFDNMNRRVPIAIRFNAGDVR